MEVRSISRRRNVIDVTSLSRPDPQWVYTDKQSHVHRWFDHNGPAETYNPTRSYKLPSLVWVQDESRYDEDGEEIPQGHYECKECGETVTPGTCADATQQFIPGLDLGLEVDVTLEASEIETFLSAWKTGEKLSGMFQGTRFRFFVVGVHVSETEPVTATLRTTGPPEPVSG